MGVGRSSDVELLERFQSGFDLGFEELVARYESKLYSLCLSLTRSEMEAEAVLSEVFCAALDELPAVVEEQRPIQAWLFRLTIDRAAEREALRLPELDVRFSPTHLEVLESGRAPMEQDEVEIFRTAVQNLPYEYRVVYLLHESMNLCIDGVTEILKISEIEARAFLHRSRMMVCRHVRRFRGMVSAPTFEPIRSKLAPTVLLN